MEGVVPNMVYTETYKMSKADLTGQELDIIVNCLKGSFRLYSLATRKKFPDEVNTESYQVWMTKSPAKVT